MPCIASGCESPEEADKARAGRRNGHTWTVHVLNSGKVDEQRFTDASWAAFQYRRSNRSTWTNRPLGQLGLLPSRFVFKHQILPARAWAKNGLHLATYDVFNNVARRLAAQLVAREKDRLGAGAAQPIAALDQDALRRRRGDLRGNPANHDRNFDAATNGSRRWT